MQNRTFLMLTMAFIIVCLTSGAALGQTVATPHKQTVILKIKNGNSIRGTLLHADRESVKIEVENVNCPVEIERDEVANIVFTSGDVTNNERHSASRRTSMAAREALEALRKMEFAAATGVNYREYGDRLANAEAAVSEAVVNITDRSLKTEIYLALDNYRYAGQTWQLMLESSYIPADSQLAKSITAAYHSVMPQRLSHNSPEVISRRDVLNAAWNIARKHLSRATLQLEQ